MTIMGALVLGLAVAGLVGVPRALPVAVGAAAALPHTAGVVAAGYGVPLFFCVAVLVCVQGLRTPALGTRALSANALAVFVVWSVLVTALAPAAFAGVPVLSPREGVDEQVHAPSELAYTVSAVAQVGYLVLAACTVVVLVRLRAAGAALATAAVVGTVLSAVRGLLDGVAPGIGDALVDTLPGIYYATGDDGRLRGVFAEPSELAAFSLPVVAWAAVTAWGARGGRRIGAGLVGLVALVLLLLSASGTAVTAAALVLGTGVVLLAAHFVRTGGAHAPWVVLGALGVAVVVLLAGERLTDPVAELVRDKVGSQSWGARTAADLIGLRVLVDTHGFGAGLGGNRSSSFLVSLASCVGVVGLALFLVMVASLAGKALNRPEARPAAVALLTLVATKAVSAPDLSTPLLWVLVAAGGQAAWPPRPCSTAPPPTRPHGAPPRPVPSRPPVPSPSPVPSGTPTIGAVP